MATNKVTTIKISANLPIMFINKYGVGVNGVAADSSNSLKIKGNANIAGTLNATNVQVGGNNVYHTGRKPTPADIGAASSSHSHPSISVSDVRNTNPTPNDCTDRAITTFFNNQYGDGWRSGVTVKGWSDGYCAWQLSNPSSTAVSEQLKFRAGIGTSWNSWRKIYHEGNKPTPTEIGAIPESNREIRFLGNVKSGTVIFDKTKLKNGVKVSFMTSNKMGTDSWHYAINGKWTDGWTMSQEAKYVFDFTKIKPDGSVWLYEVSVFNTYRESIGSRRCDGASKLYIGELNTLMVYLDHATNVCDNLTALIEYY